MKEWEWNKKNMAKIDNIVSMHLTLKEYGVNFVNEQYNESKDEKETVQRHANDFIELFLLVSEAVYVDNKVNKGDYISWMLVNGVSD